MATTQKDRLIAVQTPLGEDALLLTSFSGHEEMSRLFGFQLEMLSETRADDIIKPEEIIGKNITFSVILDDGETERFFNGYVSRFSAGARVLGRYRRYRAEVVPWLWFLTRTANCRIFQDQTAYEIIEEIFTDAKGRLWDGAIEYDDSELSGDGLAKTRKREYCVQYRETDFNFVSRLMEEEGVYYYFQHEDGKHTLVLSDKTSGYQKCQEFEPPFQATSGVGDISAWEHQYELRPGKWSHTDYNFETHPARTAKTPSSHLEKFENTRISLNDNGKLKKYEVFDYPGEYETPDEGGKYARLRMEEEEVTHDVVTGSSACKTFNPGCKFKVATTEFEHAYKPEEGNEFVLTSVQHAASDITYLGQSGGTREYRNTFTCIPSSVTFRPPRITHKPVVHGSQTAVVTGTEGTEEIYTDEYGRIMVQFFWDRRGERKDRTTCMLRCSQISAGKNWGAMFLPRVGQEVVVSYLEGNPDRPLITGMVYNADQMPHYPPVDHKTRSYIKTNSSPGGDGFNELRFEDKKDEEQIFIHAQRNMGARAFPGRAWERENLRAWRAVHVAVPTGHTARSTHLLWVSAGQGPVRLKAVLQLPALPFFASHATF